jgi:hypothetical protein
VPGTAGSLWSNPGGQLHCMLQMPNALLGTPQLIHQDAHLRQVVTSTQCSCHVPQCALI